MGSLYSKTPTRLLESNISYELLCNALSKWYGEPAFLAHIIWLDDFSTSYISEVIRWKVCAKHGSGQEYAELVVKFFPRNKTRAWSFRSADFLKNEITFYESVLPKLLEFQNSKEISGSFDNHAKLCFTYCDGVEDMICLGNMKFQGFENATESMDIEHGKLTLRTLARLHALSFALKTQNQDQFETLINKLSETYYSQNYWGWYKKLRNKICFAAIKAVEDEYPGSIYVKKIKEFAVPKRYKDLVKAVESRQHGVILHGDCKTSNYLFNYVEDRPTDVKMVDFRQARYANPALDISSVLLNNIELLKDVDALLKYYHGNLVTRIKELGGDPVVYTFDMLAEDFKKYAFFGLAFSFEAVCTKITRDDICDKLCEWGWDSEKIVNIADCYKERVLENQERSNLAENVVYCVNNGYI